MTGGHSRPPRLIAEVVADLQKAIGRTASPRLKSLLREAATMLASPDKSDPLGPDIVERMAGAYGRTLEQSREDEALAVAFNRAISDQYTDGQLVNATAIVIAAATIMSSYAALVPAESRENFMQEIVEGFYKMTRAASHETPD